MISLFGLYDLSEIRLEDPGIRDYITLDAKYVPRTAGRYAKVRFYRSKYSLLERLMSKLQVSGHLSRGTHKRTSGTFSGKGTTHFRVIRQMLVYLEKMTQLNPVQVVVTAVEHAAPREEVTSIEYGGARYLQAVESAPQRRIDIALRNLVTGANSKAFKSKTSLYKALGDEILQAYHFENTSFAISKKTELERQADSSR